MLRFTHTKNGTEQKVCDKGKIQRDLAERGNQAGISGEYAELESPIVTDKAFFGVINFYYL